MSCTRCSSIMYGHARSTGQNHRRGCCSDGAPSKPAFHGEAPPPLSHLDEIAKVLPWPQPDGIFTNGNRFHPLSFLAHTMSLYQNLVEADSSLEHLSLEMQSLGLYISRRRTPYNGSWYVRIPTDLVIDPAGASFVERIEGEYRIRINWLSVDDNNSVSPPSTLQ